MEEICPGVWHWTAQHEGIGAPVSSHYVEAAAAVFDPMEPAHGLAFFDGRPLQRVVLANRHHYRHADRFAEHFSIPVLAVAEAMHEVGERPGVTPFAFGEAAPGVTVHPVEPSWPDEGIVHIAAGDGLLLLGDCAMHYGEEIGFTPDQYLGDDPEHEKALLRAGISRLLDLDLHFDTLLFSHGTPVVGGGREALRALVAG